jgi:hypothetical protein
MEMQRRKPQTKIFLNGNITKCLNKENSIFAANYDFGFLEYANDL